MTTLSSFLVKLEAVSINVFYVEAAGLINLVLARMKRLVERDICLTRKISMVLQKLRKLSEKHTFSVPHTIIVPHL